MMFSARATEQTATIAVALEASASRSFRSTQQRRSIKGENMILISGASGNVGYQLVDQLLAGGAAVRV